MIIQNLCECCKITGAQYRKMASKPELRTDKTCLLLKAKNDLLQEMMKFVYEGNWARVSTLMKFKYFVQHDFNYDLFCKQFNIPRKRAGIFISRCDSRLAEILSAPLHYLRSDDPEKARSIFYSEISLLSTERDLGYDLSDLLPDPQRATNVQVSSCNIEIEILRIIFRSNLGELIMRGDRRKLAHLLFLMSTNSKAYLNQKAELMAKLRY